MFQFAANMVLIYVFRWQRFHAIYIYISDHCYIGCTDINRLHDLFDTGVPVFLYHSNSHQLHITSLLLLQKGVQCLLVTRFTFFVDSFGISFTHKWPPLIPEESKSLWVRVKVLWGESHITLPRRVKWLCVGVIWLQARVSWLSPRVTWLAPKESNDSG